MDLKPVIFPVAFFTLVTENLSGGIEVRAELYPKVHLMLYQLSL